VVVQGRPLVTLGDEVRQLGPGETVEIPIGVHHRLENPTDEAVEVIEVQRGIYLGEDDIIRIEDDYGRRSSPEK
jgi:mannose-6-phosphate isomerase-like protein (cupin superfamily)